MAAADSMEAWSITPQAFWYLRHGETDWNAQGLSQGNIDIPLNPAGLGQARAAALLLKGRGIRSIVASTLSRAHDTANIAAAVIGQPVLLDDDLRECSFGVQEGQPMSGWFEAWTAGTATPDGRNPSPTFAPVPPAPSTVPFSRKAQCWLSPMERCSGPSGRR